MFPRELPLYRHRHCRLWVAGFSLHLSWLFWVCLQLFLPLTIGLHDVLFSPQKLGWRRFLPFKTTFGISPIFVLILDLASLSRRHHNDSYNDLLGAIPSNDLDLSLKSISTRPPQPFNSLGLSLAAISLSYFLFVFAFLLVATFVLSVDHRLLYQQAYPLGF